MLKTRVCSLLGIDHPVVLGGMGPVASAELVAAVSNAGGLGVQACTLHSADRIAELASGIRRLTSEPFGLNLLFFDAPEASIEAAFAARPPVISTGWARADQDLRVLFDRAHEIGAKVMHMVSTVHEAERAAEAGADLIIAQGTEGGGHVGLMGTIVLVPLVVRAVAPIPVLAAGGIADGAGLAAALAIGAEGVLLGTRFLASAESPLPEHYKRSIVESDGHDTILTQIPDIVTGRVWPGAYSRVVRNRFVEDWVGREVELQYRQAEVRARLQEARSAGDASYAALHFGQTAGLIDRIEPAAAIVERTVREAEAILRERLPGFLSEQEVGTARG